MRKLGPIGGSKRQRLTKIRKQFGKFESIWQNLNFMCVRRTLPDGTRIKTITMKNYATGKEMTISGGGIGIDSGKLPFRVARTHPPIEDLGGGGEEQELELKMDSGWIAYDAVWLSENLDWFPLGVYINDSVITYFGQGTAVPGGDPSVQYLIPTAEWSDPRFLPPRLDWPGTSPPVTATAGAHTYESPIITEAGKLPYFSMNDPNHGGATQLTGARFTGLLRLAVQAKIGAGRSPYGLLWETTIAGKYSASSGLVHDNQYNFWKIAIESNGALAKRLTHQFELDWIVVQFRAGLLGSYGDEVYTKYMAWLLMSLFEEPANPTVSMLNSADLEDVYDGREPLRHGWHYNRNDPFEGSIVTTKEIIDGASWWIECTLAQVNIGFVAAGGDPSMQLVLEIEDEKAGPKPTQPLWIEDRYGAGGVDPVVPPFGKGVALEGDDTPVYCFYDDDNERQELTWTAEYTDSRDLIRELCYACGLIGKGYDNWWGAGDFTVGGWSIGEFSYADPEFGEAVLQTIGNLLISQEGIKTGEHIQTYDCSSTKPAQRSCGGHPGETCVGPEQGWPYPDVPVGVSECGGDVLFETGNAAYQRFDETEYVLSFRNFAIIPKNDAEAVLIGKAKERHYAKRNREWAYECCSYTPLAFTPLTHYWNGVNIGPLETWHNPLYATCPHSCISGGSSASSPDVDEWIPAWSAYHETIVHTVRSSGEPVDANQDYEGDNNDFYADWSAAYGVYLSDPHEEWSTPTDGSYAGEGMVYSEIPSEIEDGRKMDGGFPALDHDDLHAITYNWVGWI